MAVKTATPTYTGQRINCRGDSSTVNPTWYKKTRFKLGRYPITLYTSPIAYGAGFALFQRSIKTQILIFSNMFELHFKNQKQNNILNKSFILVYVALLIGVIGIMAIAKADAAPLTINTGGIVWKDTDGNQINAHGTGMLQVGNTFHWYGENRSKAGKSAGISCYSSTDLVNWTFKNQVLSHSNPGLSDSQFERPKVIYNSTTKKYVLWVQRENLKKFTDAQAPQGQIVVETAQAVSHALHAHK